MGAYRVAKPYWLIERQFTAAKRRELAKKGFALPDGSFPIETKGDLKNAIGLVGNSNTKAAAKRHVIKRARALGAVSMLPKSWGVKEATVPEKMKTLLPLANKDFRTELGKALVSDSVFAKDMSVAAAKALAGDPLQEAERSHDQTRQAVSQALRDKYRQNDDDYGPWVREIYDDRVVFEHEGDTWQCNYSIDDDENVTLEARVEVEITYVPVVKPTTESDPEPGDIPSFGDFLVEAQVPLVEKAVRRDDTIEVKLIAPGRGSKGYYPAEMLEEDAPAAFPAGTKMYWNHPTEEEFAARPERDLRDLAAELVTEGTFKEEGTDGPGVYADAKVFGDYKDSIEDLSEHIGTSIFAGGSVDEAAEGPDGQPGVVEHILPSQFNTVDFVTLPGAGGKVMQLFESARGRGKPPAPRKEEEMDLKEAQSKLAEAERERDEAKQKLQETEKERDELKQSHGQLQEGTLIREANDHVMAGFEKAADEADVKVPTVARKRIAERLSDDPPKKDDGSLDKEALDKNLVEAIKQEAAYLAEVTGSGKVTGLGDTSSNDDDPDPEESETELTESFRGIGLDEESAKAAAKGR